MNVKVNTDGLIDRPSADKVVFKTQKGWYIVYLQDIIRCESNKGYSTIYTKQQGEITIAKKIIDLQQIVKGEPFLRVHQSHLINLNEVQFLKKGRNTILCMSDGSELPVSAVNKQKVFKRLLSLPSI